MSTGIKRVLVLVVAGIAGCAMPPRAMVESAAWTFCEASSPGARCDVKVVASSTGRYRCDSGRFDVVPEYMQLRGGRPVNVRFSLPADYQFCSADGAALKAGSLSGSYSQLYESFAADKDDGSRSSFDATKNCRGFWIWNWGNVGAGTEHEYLIRFRDRDGRQCTIDPFIRNG